MFFASTMLSAAGKMRRAATLGASPAVRSVVTRSLTSAVPRALATAAGDGSAREAPTVPREASVVIVGGGVIGASVAYHLSKLGRKNVVLLEQGALTSGTTWHAAGLIGLSRATESESKLSILGANLLASLEEETGQATGYKVCGSVTVARTPERMQALHRQVARNRSHGVDCEMVSPADCGAAWSHNGVDLMRTDDLEGGMWIPGDGSASPTDLTMALVKGAKSRGVKVFEHTRVHGFRSKTVNGRPQICGVDTAAGPIDCEVAVLCAGQWSRQVAADAGVNVPLHSAEHFYMVTAGMDGVHTNLPVMRDLDAFTYFREWSGGLCMGGFEPVAKPAFPDRVPDDWQFGLFPDDWDHFNILLEGAIERVPSLAEADVHSMVNGPESFTTDSRYILGEAPDLAGLFVTTAMNSSGIASSGGAGKAIAEWIVGGEPSMDLWSLDLRRFGPFHANKTYLKDRISETLGLHYAMPWPTRELRSGRNLRRSPLNMALTERGAQWGEKFGWERPSYFTPGLASGDPELRAIKEHSFGHGGHFASVGAECKATRESVAVFDQSSFAKFLVQGRDACRVLNTMCAKNVDVTPGTIVYTGMLNSKGGYESDVTITRVDERTFFVVSPTAQATRDRDWMSRNMGPDDFCTITDVSGAYATISVMGPRSRELLTTAGTGDASVWSDESFPFATAKDVELGTAMANARRVTYVGELGWELYVPTESAHGVYEALVSTGQDMGLCDAAGGMDAGYYAIDSLRIEKAYRAWGHELTPGHNPVEAGLMFAVDLDKPSGFTGRDAVMAAIENRDAWKAGQGSGEVPRRLVSFVVQDQLEDHMVWGSEAVLLNDQVVGYTTSAAYGHTIGAPVCLGYVQNAEVWTPGFVRDAEFTLQVGPQAVRAKASIGASFDPRSRRVRGDYSPV